jgi:hypothetical protein
MTDNKTDLRDNWVEGTRITEEDVEILLNLSTCCFFCKKVGLE